MARRDARGRFISENAPEPEDEDTQTQNAAADSDEQHAWASGRTENRVSVETGRGNAVSVPVGSPFVPTVNRIADEANYGGYFRVFLNGEEVLEPTEAPTSIEEGMRIAIVPYDKVG